MIRIGRGRGGKGGGGGGAGRKDGTTSLQGTVSYHHPKSCLCSEGVVFNQE